MLVKVISGTARVIEGSEETPKESFLGCSDCTFKNASISPTAGIKSGMKGFSLWSSSIN